MSSNDRKTRLEYGDFQTPPALAEMVCRKLVELNVNPNTIIEPTCGVGNFIEAAARSFPSAAKIIGVEINQNYLTEIRLNKQLFQDERCDIFHGDFFRFNWKSLVDQYTNRLLVLGNFPWVTNSQQGTFGSENLPKKNNFQNHKGLDALTGKSNFDISEWMLIQAVQWLQKRDAYLAMLCKTSTARKLLNYIHSQKLYLADCATYTIDAKKYFDANVDACLLVCKFDSYSRNYFCDVFSSLETSDCHRIGYHNNLLVKDIDAFSKLSNLYAVDSGTKWRSGVKHDCSSVMEFKKIDNYFVNKLGEVADIEETYLFPMIKGSGVAQNRINATDRYMLITQKNIGESTENIQKIAPKTGRYLESRGQYLDNRKSKIYENNPRFAIFGVGDYTFKPWKIAIGGLYKKLEFRLIGEIANKPVVFDDTVYFLSFDDEGVARQTFELLNSSAAIKFYSAIVFWDEKRPIKSSVLNCLNLALLADSEFVTADARG
ncbi:MAG: class I SAM-dependent methyltransferase [Microcoleus sp. PH2017_29_MFU_D_A]|uniref:class I SAM-dependent methyltransferase n=1 Tax=unclassified Microcoleus TaxID=2642155 RepID=UPI001E106797|nr:MULTISPECIES: class I SAM-dependent methyltransferase [unclassified Microcoleus]MCC3417326.1 class I SAM-dependent methyltransferase [Microcoleus sp. PH2017_07_MST_O_A]MCC3511208.1 class I SAM-dependent methyltransferase [Microcoleus sp. PH2017_17_BER_D_A]TAE70446.1 MAG: class I SAM-dependent methyltransferase [Oscillatoriales cyanobacterium]MCC3602423.1 class I SAM-dependent methyltransferase [Microcoleus sp. PH2017_29_MFU_D_A]MCC3634661.1 class I SAM-dependent methyltransferase [Microcole